MADLLNAEVEWYYSTKERLSPEAVRAGLLDHGLFGEKVPPCFTSLGLSAVAVDEMAELLDETDDKKLRKSIDDRRHDYVRYEALRDTNVPRQLGIPHPECYATQVLAIAKHWKEIALHANRPSPAISRVHVRNVGNGRIFEMNYKGLDRFRLEEDELRWMSGATYVVEADIATCFPSIYTHSIPWALHGKAASKQSRKLSGLMGNLLDKCTQNTRDGQTNGLLIGPHASNIISEVILTQIDVELQAKGYAKIVRHIDDYRFYADTVEQAEAFVRDLGLCLRAYEMALNERKTRILNLPRPSADNWRLVLNRFTFPAGQEIRFSVIRSFLDLALECAHAIGKSTPLNYAIKTLAGRDQPLQLNGRAKRMYAQEAMNLSLAFPYLAPLLDKYVLTPYWRAGLEERLADFLTALVRLGARKIYPDAIAHALFLALKYKIAIKTSEGELAEIVQFDDCVVNVMLLAYAQEQGLNMVQAAVKDRAGLLKADEARERDRQWLLLYQTWSTAELKDMGQRFLATLKERGVEFFAVPSRGQSSDAVDAASITPGPPQGPNFEAAASV